MNFRLKWLCSKASCLARASSTENAFALCQKDSLRVHFQGLGVGRFGQGVGFADFAFFDKIVEGLIETNHAFFTAGFDCRAEALETILFNDFAHSAGVDHDFLRRTHAAGDGWNHSLTNDRLQCGRELAAHLIPLVGPEKIENAPDSLGGVGGMDGG